MYLSTASQGTWYTAPASDGTFEPTSVPVTQPKASAVKPAPSTRISPSSSEVGRQSSRPIAVIDVPNVGLRNVPDIHMKASAASLKRGEHVEVIRKISGKGPAWVKIKTKSGKVGWVVERKEEAQFVDQTLETADPKEITTGANGSLEHEHDRDMETVAIQTDGIKSDS